MNPYILYKNMSIKERKMFEKLGVTSYIARVDSEYWTIHTLYESVGQYCFLHRIEGKAADSLRRCLIARQNCNPYRGTPEYDALIEL